MSAPYYSAFDFSFAEQNGALAPTTFTAPVDNTYYPTDFDAVDPYNQFTIDADLNLSGCFELLESTMPAPTSNTPEVDFLLAPPMDIEDLDAQSRAAQQEFLNSQAAAVSVQQPLAAPILPVHPAPQAAPAPSVAAPRTAGPKHISALDLLEANMLRNPTRGDGILSLHTVATMAPAQSKPIQWEVVLKNLSKQQFRVFYYEQQEAAQFMSELFHSCICDRAIKLTCSPLEIQLPALPEWIRKYCFSAERPATKTRKVKTLADKLEALPTRAAREHVVAKQLLNRHSFGRSSRTPTTRRVAPY